MKIFLAGATGAVGRALVPLLVAARHQVVATTRTVEKLDALRRAGADAVVMDALDPEGVAKAVHTARPEVIVHEMTALPQVLNLRKFDDELALTNRLRTDGARNLLTAGATAGVRAFVAQSYTGWPNVRDGGPVKTEEDPLDTRPPSVMARTLEAIRTLEQLTTHTAGIAGTALRYGGLYGPGTSIATDGEIVKLVRRRAFPLIGGGTGVWSFIHVDDAARATLAAIEATSPGIYNVVDDEPAPVSEWLPALAHALGAGAPRRLPAWVARLLVGDAGVSMMTQIRGSSNAKAKRVLGWRPRYASWRDGFQRGLAA